MNTDFRNRVVLPLVLPLAILLGIVVVVGTLAAILLYNPREVGLMVALVVAAGFMVAFSLANAVDEEHMTIGRRAAIGAVALLPVLGGGAASLWANNGGVPEEEKASTIPAFYEPEASAPLGAIAGAVNSENFCAFEDPAEPTADTCTDTQELTFPAQPDSEVFAYTFHNYQGGVPHNLQLFQLAGSADAPEAGELVFGTEDGAEIITGEDEITYEIEVEDPALFEQDAQLYYNCVVHPAMQGVLTIGEPAAEGSEG